MGEPTMTGCPAMTNADGTVPWDRAPLRVFGIATWSTGFSWPACRIECAIPTFEALVPRTHAHLISIPSVVEEERIRTWRPFLDEREREHWQRRIGDAADLMSEGPAIDAGRGSGSPPLADNGTTRRSRG